MSTTPKHTPDQLAECGRRILAVHRGVPRRQFDTLAAEVGMLVGSLCQTAADAETLTALLVAYPMARWDWPTLQLKAKALANAKPPADPEPWRPPYYSDAEFEAIKRRAAGAGLDIVNTYEKLLQQAVDYLASMKPKLRDELLTDCAEEWKAGVADYIRQTGNTRIIEPPFLRANAENRALARIEKFLLMKTPLTQWDKTAV